MNRRTVAVALAALALTACIEAEPDTAGGITINPSATGVENLPAELVGDTTLYTAGSARLPLPCFASVTVHGDGGETIAGYQEFTDAGSYTVPSSANGSTVTEFNTQGCQPWTLEP